MARVLLTACILLLGPAGCGPQVTATDHAEPEVPKPAPQAEDLGARFDTITAFYNILRECDNDALVALSPSEDLLRSGIEGPCLRNYLSEYAEMNESLLDEEDCEAVYSLFTINSMEIIETASYVYKKDTTFEDIDVLSGCTAKSLVIITWSNVLMKMTCEGETFEGTMNFPLMKIGDDPKWYLVPFIKQGRFLSLLPEDDG